MKKGHFKGDWLDIWGLESSSMLIFTLFGSFLLYNCRMFRSYSHFSVMIGCYFIIIRALIALITKILPAVLRVSTQV